VGGDDVVFVGMQGIQNINSRVGACRSRVASATADFPLRYPGGALSALVEKERIVALGFLWYVGIY
jgi:hypothetical protein